MGKCPRCTKEVYHAEKIPAAGADWHKACLKCEKCKKGLQPGSFSAHDGMPYCNQPCYNALFGPDGCGRGGQKHKY
ncbi:cysteine-rich protein 1-like [Styela clava]|uniref:cysteine-rich protein 1-like n=1 Tax=Styela clava TaxID=7725 RepID=UPI001939CA4C|nr:cysteine-rich protein 1-like [Styela clava]